MRWQYLVKLLAKLTLSQNKWEGSGICNILTLDYATQIFKQQPAHHGQSSPNPFAFIVNRVNLNQPTHLGLGWCPTTNQSWPMHFHLKLNGSGFDQTNFCSGYRWLDLFIWPVQTTSKLTMDRQTLAILSALNKIEAVLHQPLWDLA